MNRATDKKQKSCTVIVSLVANSCYIETVMIRISVRLKMLFKPAIIIDNDNSGGNC